MKSALVLGASGLIGGHCLDLLLREEAYSQVVALVRKPLSITHPKLTQHIVDFDRLQDFANLLKADDVFCCLGTTIKKAGSQEAFRKVDFTYAHEAAKIAANNGATQFLLVTSIGADAKSSVFYSRVKGEIEAAISALNFVSISIFRPSFLIGERSEFRLGERLAEPIAKAFSFLLIGSLRKYRPIEAYTVAVAMIEIAKAGKNGVSVYELDQIQEVEKNKSPR